MCKVNYGMGISPWKSRILRESVLWFLLGLVVWSLASLVPARIRGLSPVVLPAAGARTLTPDERVDTLLRLEQIASASLLREATTKPLSAAESLIARKVFAENPVYRTTGGPAPYFEEYLRLAYKEGSTDLPETVLDAVFAEEHLRVLQSFLTFSTREAVQRVLEAQDATGWQFFLPPRSAAGRPLRVALLLLALSIQSEFAGPETTSALAILSTRALDGDLTAVAQIEEAALGMLTLARRLTWLPLAHIVRACDAPVTLGRLGALVRDEPDRLPVLYGAIAMGASGEQLADYLEQYGFEGWESLAQALPFGQGAVAGMLERGRSLAPVPRPFRWLENESPILARALAWENPGLALGLRLGLLLLGGVCLIRSAAGAGTLLGWRVKPRESGLLEFLLGALGSAIVAGAVLLWMEPILLEPTPQGERPFQLRIRVLDSVIEASARTFTSAFMDRVTIIVLIFFLVFQLVIYLLGLLKIADVRKRSASPALKLRLLENEDTLFDLGLYVGLSGTVLSLIFLALDIVQASLIAAYASTLFGIIFVAVLKVFHVRPYRRLLLVQADRSPTDELAEDEPPASADHL